MRMDYFHTGGRAAEVFAVDRVSVEPLPWPGNLSRTIDDGRSGTYRFEVRDGNGTVLYARGFSSIYAEWVRTAEAATSSRTFHESLRFPAPAGVVQVTVFKRDDVPFCRVCQDALERVIDLYAGARPARH
jgi:hypothetical protein